MRNSLDSRFARPVQKRKKVNIIKYAKEIRAELKKVVWPTRAQLVNNTLTVLIACIIIGVIIFLADKVFFELSKAIFG